MQVFNIVFLIYTFTHSIIFESHIVLLYFHNILINKNMTFINILSYTKQTI